MPRHARGAAAAAAAASGEIRFHIPLQQLRGLIVHAIKSLYCCNTHACVPRDVAAAGPLGIAIAANLQRKQSTVGGAVNGTYSNGPHKS